MKINLLIFTTLISALFVSQLPAQCLPPAISSFSPLSGATGTTIAIDGINFDPTPANNVVYFGAAKASVLSASTTQLTVAVPLGATYNHISVTISPCALTAYSPLYFNPVSVCAGDFSAATVDNRIDYTSPDPRYGPYGIWFGDFDLDGKTDVMYPTAFGTIAGIVIARNQSVPGIIDLSSAITISSGESRNAAVADFDGDGKLDIVFVVNSLSQVRILRNTSSGPGNFSFAAPVPLTTNSSPYQVAANDIDGDGKPDLAVSHFGSNNIAVFRNTGTTGAVSFAAKQDFNVGAAQYGVGFSDFNGDNKAEIIATPNSGGLRVLTNTSTPGSISFSAFLTFSGATGYRLAIGDLNADGKNDIVFANIGGNGVGVYHNTSSAGNVSFASALILNTTTPNHRVSISDLNGDGKPDISACYSGNNYVSCLINTTTTAGGTISVAAPITLTTTGCTYALGTADIDGDGNNDILAGDWCSNRKLSVFRNNVLGLIPVTNSVSPTSGLTCNSTVTISYYAQCNGANPGNVYTAQLSDANGNFSVPINIGSVTSTTSGTIIGTIPDCIATGSGYRVRVVGSDPATTGTVFGTSLSITCQTITPATINTSPIFPLEYCPGAAINVSYTVNGSFGVCADNTFTAQLSDAGGSFATPVNIGSVVSNTSGAIAATIPLNTPSGASYRIRVVSDQPQLAGTNNGSNINITTQNCVELTCVENKNVNTDENTCSATVNNIDPLITPSGATVSYTLAGATTGSGNGSVSGMTFNPGNTTVIYTSVDDPAKTCSFVITVTDNQKPTFTCPGNDDVDLNGSCQLIVPDLISELTGNDNCGTVTFTQNPALGTALSSSHNQTHNIVITADDGNGNTEECTVVLTGKDVTKPTFTCPVNDAVDLDGSCQLVIPDLITGLTGNDNCGTVTFTQSPLAGAVLSSSHNQTHNIVITANDGNGNTEECTVVLTGKDVTKPTFTCPVNDDVELNNNCQLIVPDLISELTGNDNCGTVTFSQNPAAGTILSSSHNQTHNIVITADDGNGNSEECTVVLTGKDVTKPTFTCPVNDDVDLNSNCNLIVPDLITALTGNDNCGTVTFTQNPVAGTTLSSSHGSKHNVVITADDGNGNTEECTVVLTGKDVTPPSITCPANATGNTNDNGAGNCTTSVSLGVPITDDNCHVASVKAYIGATEINPSTHLFTTGQTTVTWKVMDDAGNAAQCDQLVTVTDNENPVITVCAPTQNVNLNGNCGLVVPNLLAAVTANDNRGYTLSQSPVAGAILPSSHNQAHTIIITATDGAGLTATCNVTLTSKDVTPPSITCPANISLVEYDPALCGAVVNYTTPVGTDNCSGATTEQIAGLPTGAVFPWGITTNTFKVTDAAGMTTNCSFAVTVNVGAPTNSTLSITPGNKQYSDEETFTATIAGGSSSCGPQAATHVTFYVGTQNMGTVPLNVSGANLVGELTAKLLEGVAGQMSPGVKTVSAVFSGVNVSYAVSNPANKSLTIIQENALVDYTGDVMKATATATALNATITLKANIIDISAPQNPADPGYDPYAGDIRNARVMFVNRDNGNAPLHLNWLPVTTLINPLDSKAGTVSVPLSVTLGSTEDYRFITVGIIVNYGGYYIRDNAADNVVVTVYKPSGDFITGGGYIVPTLSVGTKTSDPGKKTNFGFTVKFGKKGINLKGNMNIIFRRTENNIVHVYQIKANAMQSLGVNASNPGRQTAEYVSKTNLTDITNPLAPALVGGNKYLYVKMTDNGEPGTKDSISFVLVDGTADPTVLSNIIYSSNWTGYKTEQLKLGSGNLLVHSGFNVGSTASTTATRTNTITMQQPKAEEVNKLFAVKVWPNPAEQYFTLHVDGNNNETVNVKVFDVLGRQVYVTKGSANQNYQFGANFVSGAYIVEVRQGEKRSMIKLIKQ